jgi:hypothetical protein
VNADDLTEVHVRALVASLDCAVDELRDALDTAHQIGAYDVPHHRRNADQDDAVIRVGEAREGVEEYLELVFTDRYDMGVRVTLEVIE